MKTLIYHNTTKRVVAYRVDGTTVAEKPTAEFYLTQFIKLHDFSAADYSIVILPFDEKHDVQLGRDLFDPTTNKIYADPKWVAPSGLTV